MRCPFDQAICVIAGVVGIAKASNTALMCVASGESGQKLFSECGRMNKIRARSLHKLYKGGRVSMADFHFSFLQRAVNWQPFTFEHSHSGSSITFFFFFCTNLYSHLPIFHLLFNWIAASALGCGFVFRKKDFVGSWRPNHANGFQFLTELQVFATKTNSKLNVF
jgi:hypothetical protein